MSNLPVSYSATYNSGNKAMINLQMTRQYIQEVVFEKEE
jgi:hypothetical protein